MADKADQSRFEAAHRSYYEASEAVPCPWTKRVFLVHRMDPWTTSRVMWRPSHYDHLEAYR